MVGDPDQSIYGFRGADTRAVGAVHRPVPRPGRQPGARSSRCAPAAAAARSCCPLRAGSRRGCPPPRPTKTGSPERSHRALVPLPGRRAWDGADHHRRDRGTGSLGDRRRAAPGAPDRTGWPGRRWRCWSVPRPARCRCCSGPSAAAGVPVTIAGDELPLTAEPGTRPLLTPAGLRAAARERWTSRPRPTCSPGRSAAPTRWACGGCAAGCGRRRRRPGSRRPRSRSRRRCAIRASSCWPASGRQSAPERRRRRGRIRRPAVAAARRVAGLLEIATQTARGTGGRRTMCSGRCGTRPAWRPPGSRPARGRQPRRRRRRRPGRGGRAVRRGRPVHRTAAAGVAAAVPGQHGRAGDRRRHAGRARGARRGGRRPHRAPGQGARVGPGRGRRGPGGHLARRPDPGLAAVHGRTRGSVAAAGETGSAGGAGRQLCLPSSGQPPTPRPPRLASKLLDEERRLFYVAVTRAQA